ncbi:phosphonate metabolism transcriptional regulator PhnF [Rhizobium miluonense]|uniref:GntR family transcriptional regulator, phosphonate transport system regulatory protein n=1 Tax=Rhizobium miluonense TaxID=411945 RepID=A0A1C3X0S0_9HYPH|nr:phosphonate metabolism transcriptional regulator PhnF [Rhizobium miluonense]SCB45584.1 GntR family transcriptional regulator, phosphonate transport system regulatory protein [Rhizobium miluonense]
MEQDGINLWRQIGETLAEEIGTGTFAPGDRLPPSTDLATRFGVNQHTVLRAISHLQNEGMVRIERGRGTYVADVIPYRLGRRTRFEENLKELNHAPQRTLIAVTDIPSTPAIATHLELAPNELVTQVTVLAIADDIPISINSNFFPRSQLPGIGDAFRVEAARPKPNLATQSVLAALGIADFERRKIRIRGRESTQDEARLLRMPPQENVFEVEVLNVDAEGRPIVFGQSIFCLSRVEFVWDFALGDLS